MNSADKYKAVKPQLYTVEHNQTANDVTEQVVKGNIAIIKHTDNGDTQIETPESGAEFAVYLKSAGSYEVAEDTERDYLTCDENGFAQTKDMPYGIYTVHQVSGWEGSELMPDFDVFISQNGATYRYLINNAPFNSFIKIVKAHICQSNRLGYYLIKRTTDTSQMAAEIKTLFIRNHIYLHTDSEKDVQVLRERFLEWKYRNAYKLNGKY